VPEARFFVCLIDDSAEAEPVIHIDDHELSPGSSVGSCALRGLGMRIVFVEDDDADPPLVEIRDLENGRGGHDWRWTVDDPRSVPSTRAFARIRTGSTVSVPSP